jgi:hypothetical protein
MLGKKRKLKIGQLENLESAKASILNDVHYLRFFSSNILESAYVSFNIRQDKGRKFNN